jgi:ABC-type sugar transport system substrate-binding protein
MNLHHHWGARLTAGIALVCIASTALAACGSDSDKDSTSAAGDSACVSSAESFMKDWNELPTGLPDGLEPLAQAPASGKLVGLARNNSPADLTGAESMKVAAETAGWEYKLVTHDGTPEDTNAKFAQAIDEKPTAITMASIPPEMVSNSLKAAKDAGIVVGISGDPTQPTEYPGFAAATFDEGNFKLNADILANWSLVDSKCDTHAVISQLTLPVLETLAKEYKSTVESTCAACSAKIVPIQPTDIGSPAAVNAVVSAVQADPRINTIVVTLGGLATGLDAALRQAGRTDVKIIGQVPDDASFQSLKAGTSSMWVNYGPKYNSFALFDVVLRSIEKKAPVFGLPFAVSVMTADKLPADYKTGELVYPENYQSEFAKLWQVG